MIAASPSRISALLLEWRSVSVMTLAELATRFGRSPRHVDRNAAYGRMAGLIEFHNPSAHSGRFYFRDDRVRCALAYFANREDGDWPSPTALERELGAPPAVLRSRAGKDYRHAVHCETGIAYSANQDRIAFIEMFPPTDLADYQARIHDEPGEFVR